MASVEFEAAIIRAFQDLCAGTKNGCAPIDVARLLHQRAQLPPGEDAVGVASVMRRLRTLGKL